MKSINKILENRQSHFPIFLLILSFLSLFMIFYCGPVSEYPGFDFFFHFRRFNVLIEAIADRTFPFYFDYELIERYGYQVKQFYPDLTLVPFALIGVFTDAMFAYQFMLLTMTVLCGVFTYYTINKIYRNSFAASIGAILYTFSVYRLFDLYHRGALGETLTFTFIPIVFLGLYEIIKGDHKKWYILTIGFSLMLFTHLISSILMFLTALIIIAIYNKSLLKEKQRIYYLLLSGIVSLVIVSFYIFPMIEQMLSNKFYYNVNLAGPEHFKLNPKSILIGFFGGIVYPEKILFYSPGIGILLTLSICLRIFVKEKSALLRSVDIGVLIGIIYIVATSFLFPWHIYPFKFINFIQFPWRLYEFISFFFAIAGGYYLSSIIKTGKNILIIHSVVILLIMFCVVSLNENYKHLSRSKQMQISPTIVMEEKPSLQNLYHTIGTEYLPLKVPSLRYLKERGRDSINANYATTLITDFSKNKGTTSFIVNINKSDNLELPLLYYKGYYASLNNQKILISESKNGLVQIPVDQSGAVKVYYKGTIIQKISFFVTFFSILALSIFIYLQKRKKSHLKYKYNDTTIEH